jgi:oligopeptide transport system ATP-binding protein
MSAPLLDVSHLTQTFGAGRGRELRAVDDVSFHIDAGETFGLVGESGSGKTTTGRAVVGLRPPSGGTVRYRGDDVSDLLRGRRAAGFRREVQMIFQDPYASLDPRLTLRDIVAEGLDVGRLARERRDRADRAAAALAAVGLDPALGDRYPHELSGGQRQRVGIARALIVEPRLIVCDEPISALDVSVQAQVVNLLADLKRDRGLTYLFIAHDLAMVRHVSDRIGVMHRGRLVEVGSADDVYTDPLHPYTRALLSAVPLPDPDAERGRTRVRYEPGPVAEPSPLVEVTPGRWVAQD